MSFIAATLAGATVAAFTLAELTVRMAGQEPWQSYSEMAGDAFVRMRTPDPKLGWRNLPGTYRGERHSVTVLADGARKTTAPSATDAPEVWLIGGSFIYGQGISDEQTLASVWPSATLGGATGTSASPASARTNRCCCSKTCWPTIPRPRGSSTA